MVDIDALIENNMKMRKIKEELLQSDNMSYISDTVDSLTENEAKQILRLFVYERGNQVN